MFRSFSLGLKLAAIALLTLILAIALAMVNSVISERQRYRKEAVESIESSYAGPQTLAGPVLVRPYTQLVDAVETDSRGRHTTVKQKSELTATYFPRALQVSGHLIPSERRHGLYTVTVYEFRGRLQGAFEIADPKTEGKVVWGEPYLTLSIADTRGIVGTPLVKVNGVAETMFQGAPAAPGWHPNLRVPLTGITGTTGLNFDIGLELAGTETLNVVPLGDSNHIEIDSRWPSPLFAGQFLPRSRQVSGEGFTSSWDISSLASGAQQQMRADPAKPIDQLSVSLLTPIDPYKLSDRATKYGILFVLLTFAGFFLFEMLKQLPIHPIQYLLVGFGLAIFFLLLISFSERMPFAQAYLIASAACIGLLSFYVCYVLRTLLRGLGFGVMLAALYAAIYGLLISEDNALILGSLMLFLVLAAVMIVTRRVDWYGLARAHNATSPPATSPPPIAGISN